jgi:hypothetical protein
VKFFHQRAKKHSAGNVYKSPPSTAVSLHFAQVPIAVGGGLLAGAWGFERD